MSDLIDRQAAIEAINHICPIDTEYDCTLLDRVDVRCVLSDLPSAQAEPCKDVVIRSAIIQKLNTMNRYVSEELRLCDTDKKFSKNEVFIVDDVYEEIVENLPSAQPKIGKWILSGGYWRCSECKEKALLKLDKAKGNCKEFAPVRSVFCPNCGMKML